MRHRLPRAVRIALALLLTCGPVPGLAASSSVKVKGYLDFRKGEFMIVDAQRIRATPATKFKGRGQTTSAADVPLGWEVEVKGKRAPDGTIEARSVVASRNGKEKFEEKVVASTNQAEQSWLKEQRVYEGDPGGKENNMGRLVTTGPEVDRARHIVERILPPYVPLSRVRVYVVENPEWNAMAMANYSIYVFNGLMADLDDDELAIVLGHEIAHATYEHSRRQAGKQMAGGIAGVAVSIGAVFTDNEIGQAAAMVGGSISIGAFGNYFSREYEDQADRVGLRYVYEAGYDVQKAPALWRRFAAKYPEGSKTANFFFGDHSLSTQRAADLEREIRNNYSNPALEPPGRPPG